MTYGIFPRIKYKSHSNEATNNLWGITIDPYLKFLGGAIAEERVEFFMTWKWFLIITSIFLIPAYFISYYMLLAAPIIATLYINSKRFEHAVEIRGQSVYSSATSQIYGIPIETVLHEQANSLQTYYRSFKYDTITKIYKWLSDALPAANKWVFNNLETLTNDIKRAKSFIQS